MLSLRDVTVRAGGFTLSGVSMEVPDGACAVLMGTTGSGKSTLLEAICGLRPVSAGRVLLHGRDVTDLPPRERGIGYLPQDLALFPTMSVREHLGFALTIRGVPAPERERRVAAAAALLGLEAALGRRPATLSGGEKQRLALGRALAAQPSVLLLDEPFSALDEDTRDEMHALLRAVRAATSATILHVTHSRVEAELLGDRLFRLDRGVMKWCATGRSTDHDRSAL
jgi:ABC-type sugar transport system ATPase subunit